VQIEWDGRYGPSKFGKILKSAERWRHMQSTFLACFTGQGALDERNKSSEKEIKAVANVFSVAYSV